MIWVAVTQHLQLEDSWSSNSQQQRPLPSVVMRRYKQLHHHHNTTNNNRLLPRLTSSAGHHKFWRFSWECGVQSDWSVPNVLLLSPGFLTGMIGGLKSPSWKVSCKPWTESFPGAISLVTALLSLPEHRADSRPLGSDKNLNSEFLAGKKLLSNPSGMLSEWHCESARKKERPMLNSVNPFDQDRYRH